MTDKMDLDETGSSASILRHRAEGKLSRSPDTTQELIDKTPEEIIHELHVHQFELEMQSEELKRVQLELEKSRDNYRDNYADLYDFAPVGYLTLTHKGLIEEVNLTGATLLGMPRQKLIKRGFGHFVTSEDLALWDQHIIAVIGHEEKQTCDLRLKREDGSSFYALLDSIRMAVLAEHTEVNKGTYVIRTTVTDITERKRLEKEKENLIIELQKSLSEIKQLSRILPICASCKKIRDDKGYWNEVEMYISDHSETQFSHGICPDCMRKLYPEIADEVLNRLEKNEKE